jgi:hypothetical protein
MLSNAKSRYTARLKPHPSCPGGPAASVEADYWREGRFLLVRFRTMEDNDWIAWPEAAASSEWASYLFDGYREGMRPAAETVVSKGVRFEGCGAALEAQLELPEDVRRLGVSAVLRTVEGETFYWALAHPSDKPDFHHPDSFVLELP